MLMLAHSPYVVPDSESHRECFFFSRQPRRTRIITIKDVCFQFPPRYWYGCILAHYSFT